MFPEDALPVVVLWCIGGGLLALYVGLFVVTRRPVSLRPARVAYLALAVLAVRLVLLICGFPVAGGLDWSLAGVGLVLIVQGLLYSRTWLFRAQGETLREQLQTAARGLFLQCEEPKPGRFVFSAKGNTWQLSMTGVGKWLQVVALPRPAGTGKMALLEQWLAKQYPGPVPRVRIVLNKE